MEPKLKSTRAFLQQDPFNPENTLEGLICYDRGQRYGGFQIQKINGKKVDHPLIYGTPKIKYPFDRNGRWQFPSAKEILCYEKYDGTNIFMYRYIHNGETFTTYKVRLFPFLRGPFLDLWNKILKRYPKIPNLFGLNPECSGFSFELYGKDNFHLIHYNHEIDIRLLFGLKDKYPVPPRDLNFEPTDLKGAVLEKEVDRNYIYEYRELQDKYQKGLKKVDGGYIGSEGSIWYLKDKDEQFRMYKCKPDAIQQIHWNAFPLNIDVIKATALNVLEIWDEVTFNNLEELLLEEFPQEQINLSIPRIKKVLSEFDEKTTLIRKVAVYLEDFPQDADIKTEIMPALSKYFPKGEMGGVYQAVVHKRG